MEPFENFNGLVAPLDLPNVDTDQIIPKQFLKRIERTGFGKFLFYDWRFLENEKLNNDFELNEERYRGASILLTRTNFGCGSSREHAPWALMDYGFRCIIAPDYADIFFNNCFKNGLLPVRLSEEKVESIFRHVREVPGFQMTVDLQKEKIQAEGGISYEFQVDPFRRRCLLNGWDDIGLTLQHEDLISQFESQHLMPISSL